VADTAGLFIYVHRRVAKLPLRREPAVWEQLFRRGLPFAYAGIMITVFFFIGTVMLERMRGAQEAGWYSAPLRVLEGLTLLPRVIGYTFIPTMAAAHLAEPEMVGKLYRRGSKYLLVVGLPLAAFSILAAPSFVPILFGAEYGPSVIATQLMLPAALFMFLSNFGETTLACVNRWNSIVANATVVLAVNLTLNFLLIWKYGYVGAAAATLGTEAVYFFATAVALRRAGHHGAWLRIGAGPVLAAALFAGVFWAARPFGFVASGLLATAVYLPATFVFRVWDDHEKALLRKLLP
jgi:O-antigen/teichoic acid export membrane protein